MSEIEKMYRAAKVVPSHHYCNDCKYDMSAECPIRCPDDVAVYPPFTAEKQIELIKWLIQKYKDISIQHQLNLFYINIRDIYTGMVHIEFDETIAGLINNLWQGLTAEEQQQVKGILE